VSITGALHWRLSHDKLGEEIWFGKNIELVSDDDVW
jgi:hypothetical protein